MFQPQPELNIYFQLFLQLFVTFVCAPVWHFDWVRGAQTQSQSQVRHRSHPWKELAMRNMTRWTRRTSSRAKMLGPNNTATAYSSLKRLTWSNMSICCSELLMRIEKAADSDDSPSHKIATLGKLKVIDFLQQIQLVQCSLIPVVFSINLLHPGTVRLINIKTK